MSALTTTTGAKPTTQQVLTTADETKPLTNVVRDSGKADPQAKADADSPTSDPVGTVDKPTKDEPKDTKPPKGDEKSNAEKHAEAGKP